MPSKLTYAKAFAELEKILDGMQSDSIPIDKLSDSVKRSKELIEFCTEHLRKTQKEIDDLKD